MGLETSAEMHDSFVVDIETLPSCITEDNPPASSRISVRPFIQKVKLQRNLSSKGTPRENRNKTTLSASSAFTDRSSTCTLTIGGCSPKKSVPVASKGTKDCTKTQQQKTVSIIEKNKLSSTKSFKHRTSLIDPRRVLLFFAALSSMGTLLLIYFTLSICKFNGDSNTQTQQ